MRAVLADPLFTTFLKLLALAGALFGPSVVLGGYPIW